MSAASPWKLPTATLFDDVGAEQLRQPTLQEIMDEALARQLYEQELQYATSESDLSDVFSDMEEKGAARELLNAESITTLEDEESELPTLRTTPRVQPTKQRTSGDKTKQRFDRSIPVEGTGRGLNSIRESFRRWDKEGRHSASGRVEAAKFATHDAVLDERTTLMLQKLINRGDLDEVFGCMQSGKEANVYMAVGTDEDTFRKRDCAVKIFKTTLNSFSNRHDYITGDRRYDLSFQKKDRRRQMKEWSEKEFRNLSRASKCIHAPTPYAMKEHIVVMSFIGDAASGLSAPTLKEVAAAMSPKQLAHAYADLLTAVSSLFHKARLAHSDLSEYNILYHKQQCWVIDFGQAVDQTHPQFLEFLRRDLSNLRRFFERHGMSDANAAEKNGAVGVLSNEEAFEWVIAERESEARALLGEYPLLKELLKAKQCM